MKFTILLVLCATAIVMAAGVLEYHAISKGIDGKCLTAFVVFCSLVIREVIGRVIKHEKEKRHATQKGNGKSPGGRGRN